MEHVTDPNLAQGDDRGPSPADYAPPAIESRMPVHDPLLGNITAVSGGAR